MVPFQVVKLFSSARRSDGSDMFTKPTVVEGPSVMCWTSTFVSRFRSELLDVWVRIVWRALDIFRGFADALGQKRMTFHTQC